jgi:uncharacterized integral membrane protein
VSIVDFKNEVHRICALLVRFPKSERKKKLADEIQKLPSEEREIAISLVSVAIEIGEESEIAQPQMTSTQKTQLWLAFTFGVVFLAIILVIAVFIPNPTNFQYQVFRITLALAAGGVAAVIPGILNVNIPRFITAGGALAVFVVVYFYSPAQLIVKPPDSVSVSLPTGLTFRRAAELIADNDGAVTELIGFGEPDLNAPIKAGRTSATDVKSLLDHLRFRIESSGTFPNYTTRHETGKYTLVVAH